MTDQINTVQVDFAQECRILIDRLAAAEARAERMRVALKVFAEALHSNSLGRAPEFPVHLGIMNGNVAQEVIRGKLRVSDFDQAATTLEALRSDAGKGGGTTAQGNS